MGAVAGTEPGGGGVVGGGHGQPCGESPRAKLGSKPQPCLNRAGEYVSYGAFGNFTPCLEKRSTALSDYKTFSALLRIGADFQKCLGIKRHSEALTRSFSTS